MGREGRAVRECRPQAERVREAPPAAFEEEAGAARKGRLAEANSARVGCRPLGRHLQESLELTPHQVKQAEEQQETADGVVSSRLPEAYQWLLVPMQATPQSEREWKAFRLWARTPSRFVRARNYEMTIFHFPSSRESACGQPRRYAG